MNSRPIKPEDLTFIIDKMMIVNYHIKRMPNLPIRKSTFYSYKKYIVAKIIGDISEGLYKDSEVPVTFTLDNIAVQELEGHSDNLIGLTINVGESTWNIHQKQWKLLNKFIQESISDLPVISYTRAVDKVKYPPISEDEVIACYMEMVNRLASTQWSIYDRLNINEWSRAIPNIYKGLSLRFIRETLDDQNSLDGFRLKMKTQRGRSKTLDVFTRHKARKRIAAILYANFGQGPNYNFKESIKTPVYEPENSVDNEKSDNTETA